MSSNLIIYIVLDWVTSKQLSQVRLASGQGLYAELVPYLRRETSAALRYALSDIQPGCFLEKPIAILLRRPNESRV